jgi:hypothetical protein
MSANLDLKEVHDSTDSNSLTLSIPIVYGVFFQEKHKSSWLQKVSFSHQATINIGAHMTVQYHSSGKILNTVIDLRSYSFSQKSEEFYLRNDLYRSLTTAVQYDSSFVDIVTHSSCFTNILKPLQKELFRYIH